MEIEKRRADVVEPVAEPDSAAAAPWFQKYCIYQSNRLEQIRGHLMAVATVIAAICFKGFVSPPGGLWQQDVTNTTSPHSCQAALCVAGTSVLAGAHPVTYKTFMFINTSAFFSSLSIILLIVAGVPFRNKLFISMLMLSTFTTVALFAVVYLMFASQITPHSLVDDIWRTAWKCLVALLSLIVALTAVQVIGLLARACRRRHMTRQFHIRT